MNRGIAYKISRHLPTVIPAKAGIHFPLVLITKSKWVPAFAGTTEVLRCARRNLAFTSWQADNAERCTSASNLLKRVWEHKNNVVGGFTNDHHVHRLVWFERHDSMYTAIVREKAIKEWQRLWKIELIEKSNPAWRDLYPELV